MKTTRKTPEIHVTYPVRTEVMSPARFVRIFQEEKEDFESIEIIAGKLGDKKMGGKIMVHRKTPIYRTPFEPSAS